MTTLAPARPADLTAASTADLRAELARGLALTADTLTRLGRVWAELESRGEDLSDLRRGLGRTLPLIAAGRLAAEAVVAFAGRPGVLDRLAGLPLVEQRRLAAGGPVAVITPADPGTVEELPLAALPTSRVRLVLDGGEVLTPAEQRVRLPARRGKPKPAADHRYRPRLDGDTLHVGRMAVPLVDVLAALSLAAGPDRPVPQDLPDEYATVTAKLHPDEAEAVKAHARRAKLPEWALARLALRAAGFTRPPRRADDAG